MSSKGNKKGGSKGGSKPSGGSNPFQVSKKQLEKSKQDGQKQVQKEKEKQKSERQKTARKHVNDRANFAVGSINRIELKKQMQQVEKKIALDKKNNAEATTMTDGDATTTDSTPEEQSKSLYTRAPAAPKEDKKSKKGDKKAEVTSKTVPSYYTSGRTLIVGDGDFSFSSSLAQMRQSDAHLITTTAYDSLGVINHKYRSTYKKHMDLIHRGPAIVMTQIDATNLTQSFPNPFTTTQYPYGIVKSPLQSVVKIHYPFDRICFNFPHSGEQRVHINRQLLADFFVSSRPHLALPPELTYPIGKTVEAVKQRQIVDELLADVKGKLFPKINEVRKHYNITTPNNTDPFGRVLVVLRDGDPYDGWDIELQATSGLFQLENKILWEQSWWKNYAHKTTDASHNALEGGKAHIYIYKLTNIGIAMAMQEVQKNIYPLQDERNLEYYKNTKPHFDECLTATKSKDIVTDVTKVDAKIHLSPWQEKTIITAQNKIKQVIQQKAHVSAGSSLTKMNDDADEVGFDDSDDEIDTRPVEGTKRKADVLGDVIQPVKLTADKQKEIANRFDTFVNESTTVTSTTVMTDDGKKLTKKQLKKQQEQMAHQEQEQQTVEQPNKKQKIDLVMTGVTNAEKSKQLLNQLVQLSPANETTTTTAAATAVPVVAEKKSKKSKAAAAALVEATQPKEGKELFSTFALGDILALEQTLAPEVTKQRLADEKAAEEKKVADEKKRKAAEEARKLAIEEQKKLAEEAKAAVDAEKKLKADEKKAAKDMKKAIADGKAVDEKKAPEKVTKKNDKWDISQSDDMDLSREILAMLTGSRQVQDDTDDESEYGESDGAEDDYDDEEEESDDKKKNAKFVAPKSTFGLNTTPTTTTKKVTHVPTKVAAAAKAPVSLAQTKLPPMTSAFSGFGTGGLKKGQDLEKLEKTAAKQSSKKNQDDDAEFSDDEPQPKKVKKAIKVAVPTGKVIKKK